MNELNIPLSVEKDDEGKIIEVFFDDHHETTTYEELSTLTELVNQTDRPWKLTKGTDFQQKVWLELAKIPLGKTLTYGEMAGRIGSPNAQQAVGQALALNPLPVILPCHRVIQKNGSLGGFMGKDARTDLKKKLLDWELGTISLF